MAEQNEWHGISNAFFRQNKTPRIPSAESRKKGVDSFLLTKKLSTLHFQLSTDSCHLSSISCHLTITFLTDPSFILTMFRPFAGEVSWRPS